MLQTGMVLQRSKNRFDSPMDRRPVTPGRTRVRGSPNVAVGGDADQMGRGRVRGHVDPALPRCRGSRRPVGPGRARVIGGPDIPVGEDEVFPGRVRNDGGAYHEPGGGAHRRPFRPMSVTCVDVITGTNLLVILTMAHAIATSRNARDPDATDRVLAAAAFRDVLASDPSQLSQRQGSG